jgi:hypothetical protein
MTCRAQEMKCNNICSYVSTASHKHGTIHNIVHNTIHAHYYNSTGLLVHLFPSIKETVRMMICRNLVRASQQKSLITYSVPEIEHNIMIRYAVPDIEYIQL